MDSSMVAADCEVMVGIATAAEIIKYAGRSSTDMFDEPAGLAQQITMLHVRLLIR
jgi:hypothetical protein